MASKKETPTHCVVQFFKCPDFHDFQTGIVRGPLLTHRANTVINLRTHTPIVTVANDNQRSQSPEGCLVDSEEESFTSRNQPSQSLEDPQTDPEEDNSVNIPAEMEPVQLMNQRNSGLSLRPKSTYALCWDCPMPFAGTTLRSLLGLPYALCWDCRGKFLRMAQKCYSDCYT